MAARSFLNPMFVEQICHGLKLPDTARPSKFYRLMYSNDGDVIIALTEDGHKIWKWSEDKMGQIVQASIRNLPLFFSGPANPVDPRSAVKLLAMTSNDSHIFTSSTGLLTLFKYPSFELVRSVSVAGSTVTAIAFNPTDDANFAIGTDDSWVMHYSFNSNSKQNFSLDGMSKCMGKKVTDIAFSKGTLGLSLLVAVTSDHKFGVWKYSAGSSTFVWKSVTRKARNLHAPLNPWEEDIRLHFKIGTTCFLAVVSMRVVVFEARTLTPIKQWSCGRENGRITSAAYTCDGKFIFVTCMDGSLIVLNSLSLHQRTKIALALPNTIGYSPPYPVTLAMHPKFISRLALGLSNGVALMLDTRTTLHYTR